MKIHEDKVAMDAIATLIRLKCDPDQVKAVMIVLNQKEAEKCRMLSTNPDNFLHVEDPNVR